MKKAAIIFFTCIVISGCVATHNATKKQILNLNTQHFKDTIIIKPFSSGDVTKFSTLKGYRHEKYLGAGWLDCFLMGYLNRKTGKRYYQVYQFISYQGRGWREYHRVDYQTPEQIKSKPLTSYHREILNCSASRACTYEEHVVFDIEEALLRQIAARAPETQGKTTVRGKVSAFLYQLSSQQGHNITYWLLPAEVAALMEVMDEYARHALPQTREFKK
ncbi:MAG: hypothetical protein R6U40_12585 [Desulfobacterales bacterium]